jgi:hypothetical protein
MIEPKQGDDDAVGTKYKTTAIIVFSQIAFSLVLTGAAIFVVRGRTETNVDTSSLTAMWVLIIFIAAGALVVRRVFYSWDRLKNIKLLRGSDGLLQTLQSNAILLGAISEFIAILGFIIAMMSGAVFDVVRAELVALITFLINFPRKSVWNRIAASLSNI